MFRSKKLKSVSNAIKSVASRDASNGISSKMFELSEVSRYGMNGKVTTFAFDPVQSLLAIATDSGEVHVYGKQQVEVVFSLDAKIIKEMRFVKGIYLVVVDSKDSISILSLHRKMLLSSFFAPGKISCIETDPSLGWMFIGLQSGATIVYDIDRDYLSPVKIENLQKSRFFKREPLSPVVSLQWNPRDIGTILISYELITVLYSIVENDIKQQFIHTVDDKTPKVIQSVFHPNGLNILTVHEDRSLVFWDNNNGQKIVCRALLDEDPNFSNSSTNIFKVAWIQEKDEYSTSILIAGGCGDPSNGDHCLTLMNLGPTPMYSVTSYEKMANYYTNPVFQKILPVPNDSPVVDFLPLANGNPHYGGNFAPMVILVLLEDGELETLLYPSGNVTYKASLFPQSISWIRPSATTSFATSVPKKTWLGMMSSTYNRDYLLKGGYPAKKTLRVHDSRSALSTGHTNGSVRIWDASHGELDECSVFDVNVSHSLNTSKLISVDHISYAGETAELAVSIEAGDIVLYKFQVNQYYTPTQKDTALEVNFRRFSLNDKTKEVLVDIRDRAPNNVREGFMPVTAVHARKGKVSCLNNSNIGFVAVGYEDGTLLVIDRRGPAIIYFDNISKVSKERSANVTSIEFSIMEYGDDGYSSILLLCGTDIGELLIFKIIPDPSGRFSVQPYDALKATDSGPIVALSTFCKDSGVSCRANIPQMQQLSKGFRDFGQIIVTGRTDIRLITPGKSKDTHRS